MYVLVLIRLRIEKHLSWLVEFILHVLLSILRINETAWLLIPWSTSGMSIKLQNGVSSDGDKKPSAMSV